MLLAVRFYDVVLWVHITAVVTAFGVVFAYPVLLAAVANAPLDRRAFVHRLQIEVSKKVTGPAIGVILLAGLYLATDADLYSKFYVSAAFILLLVIAGMGVTVLRRNEEKLIAFADAGDESGYAATLPTLRAWTLVTIGLIVITIYLMTAKPFA